MHIVLEYVTCAALVVLMATLDFALCVALLVVQQGVLQLAGMLRTAGTRSLLRNGPRGAFRVEARIEPTTQL